MAVKPSSLGARLGAGLDPNAESPVALQIAELVFTEILDGTLETGARLPTVRKLAIELAVPPAVIERAFAELERRGVLRLEAGGAFVRLGQGQPAERAQALDALCVGLAAQAEAQGFGLDELIDGLAQLRLDRRARR